MSATNSGKRADDGDGAQNAQSKPKQPRECSTPGFVRGSLMAEMIAGIDGRMKFAINTSAAVRSRLTIGKEIMVPPHGLRSFIDTRSLQLPSRAERGTNTDDLIVDTIVFIEQWANTPVEWLLPIAHYSLMTWVYDRFSAVPYLRFLGEHGTGKTRLLQVAAGLSYRSLAVSGNISGAALFRLIDLTRGTLAIDEADFKNSAEWSDIIKVLNNGYTPGLPIVRCDGGAFQPHSFYVYGPKIISTRHRFEDAALESRCLTFETQERKLDPSIPLQLPPAFHDQAQALRNKLLGWRFDNFEHVQADDSPLRNLDPRIAQMGANLLAVAPDKDSIIDFLNRYAASTKEDSPKEIVRQILAARAGKGRVISVAEVTCAANQQLNGSGLGELTHKAIGSVIRSLGYRTRRRNTGYVVETGRAR